MTYTLEELNEMMDKRGGNLDLKGQDVTELPEGLIVRGWLNLCKTSIVTLPDDLFVVGWIDLRETPIEHLPEGLCVGGGLMLDKTAITTMPNDITVCGRVDKGNAEISGDELRKIHKPTDKEFIENKYLYIGYNLVPVTTKETDEYVYYNGKIDGLNVLTTLDGERYVFCTDYEDGVEKINPEPDTERE